MHITVRMAWHDNNWNGKICADPEKNVYCVGTHSLLADRIATNRNLEVEQEHKNNNVNNVKQEKNYTVPCFWSINAFGDHEIKIDHHHAFKDRQDKPIKTIPNDILYPYSIFTWPFKLSFVHSKRNFDIHGKYWPDLEARINDFVNKFSVNESIIFFYANYDNPVSADDMKYLLLGCSVVSTIHKPTNFQFSDQELDTLRNSHRMRNFSPMNWCLQFTHNFDDYGVLLPYKDYLEYIEKNPNDEEKLQEMKVVIDEPSLIQGFKYVAMDIDDDKCLYLLYKIRKSLLKIQEHNFIADQENTKKQLEIVEFLIETIWEKRTLYPSLAKILKYFEVSEQDTVNISEIICRNRNLTQFFDDILNKDIPDNLNPYRSSLHELAEDRVFKRRMDTLKTLSLLNLTEYQIKKILENNAISEELAQNPYILYEKYVADENDLDIPDMTDELIDIYKIDIALIPDSRFVKKDEQLQRIKADSPERLRAVIIQYLYWIGHTDGDCYDSVNNIIDELKIYPLFYKLNIRLDEQGIIDLDQDYKTIFEKRLHIVQTEKETFYYLDETKSAENLIKNVFETLKMSEYNLDIDLSDYIDESINELNSKKSDFDQVHFLDERTQLFNNIFKRGFYLLTGRAGSGKTQETAKIIDILSVKLGESTTILAPTGKATLRIAEKLQNPELKAQATPKTIDRFIYQHNFGYLIRDKDYTEFQNVTDEDKVTIQNLIVDECSMVDLFKFAVLLSIIRLDKIKRIILVGDEYQLPPIGFGKPFRDIIDYVSSYLSLKNNHYIRLESNCRHEQSDTTIIDFADIFAAKKRYYESILDRVDQDHFESESLNVLKWIDQNDLYQKLQTALDKLIKVETNTKNERVIALNQAFGLQDNGHVRINNNFKFSDDLFLDSIQILSPYRAGYSGTIKLNKAIQTDYRGENYRKASVFSYSEKIIRLVNWYKGRGNNRRLYLSNGSVGVTTFHMNIKRINLRLYKVYQYFFPEIEKSGERYNTFFDPHVDDEEAFEPAYAITVHKSQGSDFEHVFLVIPRKFSLLCKELLYTAFTRPKQKIHLFIQKTSEDSLLLITKNRSFLEKRNTSIFTYPTDKKYELQPKSGIFVKSKVEYIIYKSLEKSGLNFEYEKELYLSTRPYNIHPDFTIIFDDGTELYWEHLGMLDTQRYFNDWQNRKNDYKSIKLLDRVITTDDLYGLNESSIEYVIDDIIKNKLRDTLESQFSNHHYELYNVKQNHSGKGLKKLNSSNLLKVGAFYKNDISYGIGIMIENTNFDLEDILNNFIKSYEEAWRKADESDRKKLVEGYFYQLDYFAQVRTEDRSLEQNYICVMNIWFLEKYGFLQTDNFNGCMFIYGE